MNENRFTDFINNLSKIPLTCWDWTFTQKPGPSGIKAETINQLLEGDHGTVNAVGLLGLSDMAHTVGVNLHNSTLRRYDLHTGHHISSNFTVIRWYLELPEPAINFIFHPVAYRNLSDTRLMNIPPGIVQFRCNLIRNCCLNLSPHDEQVAIDKLLTIYNNKKRPMELEHPETLVEFINCN